MVTQKKFPSDLSNLRQTVEKLLEEKSLETVSKLSETETLRIFHELQVHQIELEMQNEELRLAKDQAEVASRKYLELYDFAPSGYFTLSRAGEILDLNLTGSYMLYKEYNSLIGKSFCSFVSEDKKPIFNLFLLKIFTNNTQETCEVTLLTHDNVSRNVYLIGIIYENADQCIVNVVDISKLRLAEYALKKSEERNRGLILKTAMDGFWLLDMKGHLLEVNETYCQMCGYSAQELIARHISDIEAIDSVELISAHLQKILILGEDRFETRLRHKDGSIFDVEINVQYQPQGGWFVAFLHDISERKTAERYREMTREILQILNESGNISDLFQRVLPVLKMGTGFDAVGIRLQNGNDFPYISQKGFSKEFLLTENSLIDRARNSREHRDNDDNICLACACGLVLSGKNDLANPRFTPGGSWWTNDLLQILNMPLCKDARFYPRNQCIQQGYKSLALLPIRNKDKVVGLIQLNSLLKGSFTRNTVEKLEGIALHISGAIMRKNAEDILKESEKRRLAILETALDGFWLLDIEGRLLEVNETYCHMSGYSARELRFMCISDLEVVETEVDIANHLQKIIANGDDRFETLHRRKDGSIFDIEVSIQYQSAKGGQFVTFLHDITDRKLTEENLRQSEERYKSLFQGNHSVMILIDPDTGEIRDANSAACLYYGWTHSEMCLKNISEINILSKKEVIAEMQIAKNEKRNQFFFKHRLANGEIRDVEVYSASIMFSGLTLLYSIIHDITERKHAEAALLNSELKFRKYIDFAPHGILVANEKGEYLDVNSAASKITGYSREELLSMKIIDLIAEESRECADNHFNRVVTEGFATNELAFVRKDGSKGFWSVDAVKLSDKVFLGFTVDISGRKQAEAALIENERLLRESQSVANIGSYSADLINGTWKASSEIYEIFGIDASYPHTLESWVVSLHSDFREELIRDLFNGEAGKKSFDHEYKIIRINDGIERWVHGLGEFDYDENLIPVRIFGTIQDISKRKQSEEELMHLYEELEERVIDRTTELVKSNEVLRQTEEKYRTVADYTYDWEYWISAEGNFNYVSPSCERISGFTADEFISDPELLGRIIFNVDKDLWLSHEKDAPFYKSPEINPEFNFRIVTKSGDLRWICCVYRKLYVDGQYLGIRASNRDITEKINTDNHLLNVTLEVEERERNRYSSELHDGLGPLLSTVKLYFQWLAETNDPGKSKIITEKGNYCIDSAIRTTHEMALGLSSLILVRSGYVKTILNYVETIKEVQKLAINFEFNSCDRFGYSVETTLYRITTELINNTIKYAKASHIEIVFNYNKDIYLTTFSYFDNGIGFDLADIERNRNGLGLLNIQQRVNILKGIMQIETSAGKGLKIYIELPVNEQSIEIDSKTNFSSNHE